MKFELPLLINKKSNHSCSAVLFVRDGKAWLQNSLIRDAPLQRACERRLDFIADEQMLPLNHKSEWKGSSSWSS